MDGDSDAPKKVVEFCSKELNINITSNQLAFARQIKPKNSESKHLVIAKFYSLELRDTVYGAGRKRSINDVQRSGVYVNADLTPLQRERLRDLRARKKGTQNNRTNLN